MSYTILLKNEKRENHIQMPTIKLAKKLSVDLYLIELYLYKKYNKFGKDIDFKSSIEVFNDKGKLYSFNGVDLDSDIVNDTLNKLNSFLKKVSFNKEYPINLNRLEVYTFWNLNNDRWNISNKDYKKLMGIFSE